MSYSVRRQLLVQVGDFLFATDASGAREILDVVEPTPVPGAVAGVLGLINRRGKVMVAGQLGPLLGLPAPAGEDVAYVVFEHGDRQVALAVDCVIGMVQHQPDRLDVDAELLEVLGARDVVASVGSYQERPCYRLDLEALFARVLSEAGEPDGPTLKEAAGGQEPQ